MWEWAAAKRRLGSEAGVTRKEAARAGSGATHVCHHDHGIFSATLEDDRLERVARSLEDLGAGGGRAGERAHVDARVGDQIGADLAVALQQADEAGELVVEPLLEGLGRLPARERHHLARLDDARVTRD